MLDTVERNCLQQDILCHWEEIHQCPLEGPSELMIRKVSANWFSLTFLKSPCRRPNMADWVALCGNGIGWWLQKVIDAPCAFTGSADLGTVLPNTERTQELWLPSGIPNEWRDKASGPRRCDALFRGRSEAPQLHLIQSFPVFKVVVKMLH